MNKWIFKLEISKQLSHQTCLLPKKTKFWNVATAEAQKAFSDIQWERPCVTAYSNCVRVYSSSRPCLCYDLDIGLYTRLWSRMPAALLSAVSPMQSIGYFVFIVWRMTRKKPIRSTTLRLLVTTVFTVLWCGPTDSIRWWFIHHSEIYSQRPICNTVAYRILLAAVMPKCPRCKKEVYFGMFNDYALIISGGVRGMGGSRGLWPVCNPCAPAYR